MKAILNRFWWLFLIFILLVIGICLWYYQQRDIAVSVQEPQHQANNTNENNSEKIVSVQQLKSATFILQVPCIDENSSDKNYRTSTLFTFKLRVIIENDKVYLADISKSESLILNSWFIVEEKDNSDLQVRRKLKRPDRRLNFSITEDGKVHITGYCYDVAGGFNEFDLSGTVDSKKIFSGTGIVNFGAFGEIFEVLRGLYSVKWRMFPENMQVEEQPDLLDIKLTRSVTFPPPSPQITDEELLAQNELQNRVYKNSPPIEQQQIREAKYSPYPENHRLESYFSGSDRRKKILYVRDKILTDIDWNEINDIVRLPELLFAIEHISEIEDKEVTDYMLRTFREEGVIALRHDWKSWTKIPLLFLLVYYNDWLTPERVEGLSKLSNRLRLIIEAVKKYGNDAPNKLDEIMITVLSKLSDKERRDYFVKSLKLRNYVKESSNLSLQKLMPNDLPPPPGPPTNMRDWGGRDGSVDHGVFLRLEDDPDRGKVLVILDADRIEVRLGFRYMTKETQRYITEMLEAQAEDAAEAKKDIDTPVQENKNTKQ